MEPNSTRFSNLLIRPRVLFSYQFPRRFAAPDDCMQLASIRLTNVALPPEDLLFVWLFGLPSEVSHGVVWSKGGSRETDHHKRFGSPMERDSKHHDTPMSPSKPEAYLPLICPHALKKCCQSNIRRSLGGFQRYIFLFLSPSFSLLSLPPTYLLSSLLSISSSSHCSVCFIFTSTYNTITIHTFNPFTISCCFISFTFSSFLGHRPQSLHFCVLFCTFAAEHIATAVIFNRPITGFCSNRYLTLFE